MKPPKLRRATLLAAALLGVGLAASPASAEQSGKTQRVGFLCPSVSVTRCRNNNAVQAFLKALRDLGYDEHRNFAIEFRSAEGSLDRLPELAAELVGLKVDVLIAPVCGAPLNAARQATSVIPIVVATCNDDMVRTGIVASLAHPGGNVTGLSKMTPELTAKRLELLKETVPEASRIAVLWDPEYSEASADWQGLQAIAGAKNVLLQPVEVHGPDGLEGAFAAMVRERADAVITFSDTMTYNFRNEVADLAIRHRLPLISPFREIADAGGLMAYGPNIPDMLRRAATYVDKILKGDRPADLPIEQPTKFDLVINLNTAKTLGLSIPPALLARADALIE